MNKELIDEIRNVLNFMEEFDTLVGKAQETDDTEWGTTFMLANAVPDTG